VRLQFEHGVVAIATESEYKTLKGNNALVVEIPPSLIYFVGK
jgi:hypothetical protein